MNTANANEVRPINAFQNTHFATKQLYHSKSIETSKKTTDEIRAYQMQAHDKNTGKKRALCLDEDANMIDQPPKKICHLFTVSTLGGYKYRKKDKQEEIKWKEYGHLPRPSTIRKYIGCSQQWKTPSLAFNFSPKARGYTAMASKIKNVPEIQSLEQGIALGFKVIKCNSL
jgi:hypothetical protein